MRKFAIMIPATANASFLSQVAAFRTALSKLSWRRWRPDIHLCLGGEFDPRVFWSWKQYLPDVAITFVSSDRFEKQGIWAQADAQMRLAPLDAEVVVAMDADILPVANFESILDQVAERSCVAGVMAHLSFPRLPGLTSRESWLALARETANKPLKFDHEYLMAGKDGDHFSPFYPNFGAVFFAADALRRLIPTYDEIRGRLVDRLPNPNFSAQIALALAISELEIPQWALPARYNFPNDEKAAKLFPDELGSVALFHYLRTEEFSRSRIFVAADGYRDFMTKPLADVNDAFRSHVRLLLGEAFPFTRADATQQNPLVKAYNDALFQHEMAIVPLLHKLDADIHHATTQQAERLLAQRKLLKSGLFDEHFYRGQNSDVADEPDLLSHYLLRGDAEGRRPNPDFDPDWYARKYMVPENIGGDALSHYVSVGEAKGDATSPEMSPNDYIIINQLESLVDRPLFHWLRVGAIKGLPRDVPGREWLERWREQGPRTFDNLMRFKQSLVAALGAETGFRLYRRETGLGADSKLVHKPMKPQGAFLREHGASYCEILPGGEPFTIPVPRVLGAGNHREITGVSRALYLGKVENAIVRGASSVIETEDAALLDAEAREFGLVGVQYEFDPAVFTVAHDRAALIHDSVASEIPEAFCLLGARSIAFGHWVWEHLLKYSAAHSTGLIADAPALIDAAMPPSHKKSLEVLFPGVQTIEIQPMEAVRVRRLTTSPTLHYAPIFEKREPGFDWTHVACSPAAAKLALDYLGGRAEAAAGSGAANRRIYLARRPWRHRKLVNCGAIEEIVASLGFEIIHPEEMDFLEQLRAIRNASVIVAPDGSANFLLLFARPGTKFCILTTPITDQLVFFDGLLKAIGVQMTAIAGRVVKAHPEWEEWADYEIEPGVFRDVMSEFQGENLRTRQSDAAREADHG